MPTPTRIVTFWFSIAMVPCLTNVGASQTYQGGGKVVRVYDAQRTRKIVQSDRITVGLLRLVLSKNKNLFSQDEQAGIQVTTRVNGYDTAFAAQTANVTQVYLVKVKNFSAGTVSLPLEGTIINNFPLSRQGYSYSSIDLALYLLKKRGDTGFGSVVRGLNQLTATTPFPSIPFSEGFKTLGSFALGLMDESNDKSNGIDQRVPVANVTLNFATDASDSSLFVDSTGTFAVVFGTTAAGKGYANIQDDANTCYSIRADYTRALLVGTKNAQGRCESTAELLNDHILMYVSATRPPTRSQPAAFLLPEGPQGLGYYSVPTMSILDWTTVADSSRAAVLDAWNASPTELRKWGVVTTLDGKEILMIGGSAATALDVIDTIRRADILGIPRPDVSIGEGTGA